MLLSIIVRLGLVGFALFLYILFVFGKMCAKSIKEGKDYFIKSWGRCIVSAFVGFFIIGIFEPSFSHLQETVFYSILSMITIVWRLNEELIS
jgi:O-antigen ligase